MQCENKMLDKSLRYGSVTAAKARNGIWIGSAALQDYSIALLRYSIPVVLVLVQRFANLYIIAGT